MRYKSKRMLALSLSLALILLLFSGRAELKSFADPTAEATLLLGRAYKALDDWNLVEAQSAASGLLALAQLEDADDELRFRANAINGKYHFYAGNYEKSLEFYDRYLEYNDDPSQDFLRLYERVEHLAQVWKTYEESQSEHFVVRWVPGRDKVMVKPALETLEKAYDVLIDELDVDPGEPKILVEFYPDFPAFSRATGLSESDVENSGTVAVCKYRRLMVTTPRVLMRGYDYQNTLSHEFVHLLIYARQGPNCPIWLHEGMAKYFEKRWNGTPGGYLPPTSESMLASALRTDQLITFDRMSPSFAKLDTPKQGALAFAEVTTTVRYIHHLGGKQLLFKILDELKTGADYRVAVKRATGKPFENLFQGWKAWAKKQNYKELEGIEPVEIELLDEDSADDPDSVNESDIQENEGWKYVRLGDMLRDRNHVQASIIEYSKGRELLPNSPRSLNKLALAYILAGDYKAALEPLEYCRTLYPSYVTTYINLGRAHKGLDNREKAIDNFEAALMINPFDPTPYGHLAEIYEQAGRQGNLEDVRQRYMIVRGES